MGVGVGVGVGVGSYLGDLAPWSIFRGLSGPDTVLQLGISNFIIGPHLKTTRGRGLCLLSHGCWLSTVGSVGHLSKLPNRACIPNPSGRGVVGWVTESENGAYVLARVRWMMIWGGFRRSNQREGVLRLGARGRTVIRSCSYTEASANCDGSNTLTASAITDTSSDTYSILMPLDISVTPNYLHYPQHPSPSSSLLLGHTLILLPLTLAHSLKSRSMKWRCLSLTKVYTLCSYTALRLITLS